MAQAERGRNFSQKWSLDLKNLISRRKEINISRKGWGYILKTLFPPQIRQKPVT